MSIAIYIRTESGDEYLYSLDKDTISSGEIISFLTGELGEEFACIGKLDVASSDKTIIETDDVWEAIDAAQDED